MSAYCKNLKICGGDAFGDSVRSVYIEDLMQWLNMEGICGYTAQMCIRDRQSDLEYDQMTLKEYIDPFTGEPVKHNK